MSPLALATLCANLYTSPEGFTIYDCDGVYMGYSRVGGCSVLTFRGSATVEDWADDLFCIPVNDPQIGIVHGGMFRGIPEAAAWVRRMLQAQQQPNGVVLAGHSLGGAHARLMAGLLVANGQKPSQLVTFGSPKPGCARLKALVEQCVQHLSYRHSADIVPTLPPALLGYIHTEPWIELSADPQDGLFQDIEDHGISLYVAALQSS